MISSVLWFVSAAFAQELVLPVLSPKASVSQDVGTVTVTVAYSSPAKRDRAVFGDVVAYDQVWRTGANAATQLTVTGDVRFGDQPVPAGTYSLLSIPGKDSWTVILNKDLSASEGSYDQAKDQARAVVKPVTGPDRERLTFLFSDTTTDSSALHIEWAGVAVPVPLTVDSKARGDRDVAAYVSRAARSLTEAARFKAEHGDIDGALALIDKALAVDTTWYVTWSKAEILHQAERHKDAYKTAEAAMTMGSTAENFFYKGRVEKALAEWPKK